MPVYEYQCCVHTVEIIQKIGEPPPICNFCGEVMAKLPSFPAMVKVKGMGGYPSRRKFFKGSAPYSGMAKEWNPQENNPFNAPPKRAYYGPSSLIKER